MSLSFECCVLSGKVSMTVQSLVQRGPTWCGVSECDRGTSQRRPRLTRGCTAMKKKILNLHSIYHKICGPSSVVGIATGYGLEGTGIESRWERNFPHLSRPTLDPIQCSV